MNNAKFNELNKYFRENKFEELENDNHGERFLKLRTISRKAELKEFCNLHEIDHANIREDLFCYLFKKQTVTIVQVNEFITNKYQEERVERQENEAYLIDQLYRLQYFDWGGSFGNSLEKNIVDNYVKKIKSYQQINEEVEGSLRLVPTLHVGTSRTYLLSSNIQNKLINSIINKNSRRF